MKRWYIIHAYSGFEKQVMRSLNERIQRSTVADSFGEVLVPTEEVVEMKDGKKRKSEHHSSRPHDLRQEVYGTFLRQLQLF